MKNDTVPATLQFSFRSFDETRRIVFGVVYEPNKMDAYGWFMEPEEVEKMAHRFMRLNLAQVIDTNHDNVPNGSYPVQSFIAREGDPDYVAGSWVLGVKITSEVLWKKIVEGELNGFSMEILVKRVPAVVNYELVSNQVGMTEPAEDGHVHYFYAKVGDNGRVLSGKTSITAGHSHDIDLNSVTNKQDGHAHRYFIGK